jgi:hypothetical protein
MMHHNIASLQGASGAQAACREPSDEPSAEALMLSTEACYHP